MRVLLLIALAMSMARPARADLADPSEYTCRDKSPGEGCGDREQGVESGVCVKTTCSRPAQPGRPGWETARSWECMMCVPGTPSSGASASEGGDTTWRIVIGMAVAVIVLAGGVVLARRKSRA